MAKPTTLKVARPVATAESHAYGRASAEIHKASAHLIVLGKLLQLAGADSDGSLDLFDAEDIFALGTVIEEKARIVQRAGETLDEIRAGRSAEAANA